jgi:hypothetical protein
MKELARMRLGVLKELKNLHKFFDNMERGLKNRNSESIQKAYIFLKTLVVMMDEGELSPKNVALNLELERALKRGIENEKHSGMD